MTLRHNKNSINYNPVLKKRFYILINLSFSENTKVSVIFFSFKTKNCMIRSDFTELGYPSFSRDGN